MIITVTQEDIDQSSGYVSNTNCPIARAVKRMFPDANVNVGGWDVKVDGKNYQFSQSFIMSRWHSKMVPVTFTALEND